MDIAAWLRELGLERYEQAFRENEIDAEILPKLSADDLKDIGVTIVGHRRKLLEAIARLAQPALVPQAEPSAQAKAPPTARPPEAERRQLTVLFCDLVGSTELSAQLDPEDLGQVIRAYHGACTEVVERWGGHVAKYMGDGVLAYFGWPQAHEDEAERAVRAGLDLVAAVAGLATPDDASLAARVGIATGHVVVGELIGAGTAQEEAVIGETPNLAARLQALAEPASVVISRHTRRLVGGLFELADLEPQQLKGFAEPVRAWRVVGESRAESRFEALHGQQLTGLVGREHEISLLADRWERAKEGEGQVVLLSGEPGIGKSRIVRALRERLAGEPHTLLSQYCSPHHTNSALYPVIGLLERAAGFTRDDRADARLDKLEALLARGTEALGEAVSLVAALLGIATGERYPPLALSPQRQKQRTLKVLVDQVEGLAARQPVLEVYEDVQWIDPTTLEALGLLIERVQRLPVLVLITFRPEFSPPWAGHAHVMQLSLSRLTRRHGQALVEEVTGGKALPDEVLDHILAKTDGVPLFVEELTKTVLESGLLTEAGDHYALAGPLPPLAIPTTLHDSLIARLDRLAPVKEVAQIGAVIGREFSHDLLAAVAPLAADQLNQALDQLAQSELVFRHGTPPEATYSFKHALVQDAAYQSLLKSRRQQLHAKIARALEQRSPDTAPEVLAYHLTEAQQYREAVPKWLAAGQAAAARSADREAVAHLRTGLQLLESLPQSRDRTEQELALSLMLGSALSNIEGSGGPEVGRIYQQARQLCKHVGRPEQMFAALWGSWAYHHMSGRLDDAEHLADEVVRLAKTLPDTGFLLEAHHAAWTTRHVRGDFPSTVHHAKQGLSLYDFDQHRAHAFVYGGHDPGICAACHMAEVTWQLGFPDRALEHARNALALGERLSHPVSLATAQWVAIVIRAVRGELDTAITLADEMLRYTAEHEVSIWHVNAIMLKAWISAALGHASEVLDEFRNAVEQRAARGAMLRQSFYLALLAEAYEHADRPDQGIDATTEALALVTATGERRWEAMIHCVRGALFARRSNTRPDAEPCFCRALEIAGAQEARSFELQAALGLAQLWAEQGKRQKAHDLLAPIYGWFTEGFDTADLKDAKALLNELS